MAKGHVVIYSVRTGRIRRFITDGVQDDASLLVNHAPGDGEAAKLGMAIETYASLEALQADLNKLTGLTPVNDRYVAVNADGEIDQIIIADPACGDAISGYVLIAHDSARIGWRLAMDNTWQRSVSEIDDDKLRQQGTIDMASSARWAERQTASGLTTRRIDMLRTDTIATAEASLISLEVERVARLGPR